MGRIQTAIHCGTPDRVPLSLVLDTFACNMMGVKYSEFCADLDVAGQTMLAATEKLGDVDSVQWASYAPADPRHALARADEAPRSRPPRRRPVATGRAGAHPAGGLRPHRRDGLGAVVRPVHRQVPGRGGGGRRGDAGEGAALGRRVHGARLRGVQRHRRSTTPTSTSAAAGRSRNSPWTCSRGRTRSRRRWTPSWPRSASRPGRWSAPSGRSATGSAAGARRRSSSRPSCGTASCGRT